MKVCPSKKTCVAVAVFFTILVAAILYAGFTKAPVPLVRYDDTRVFCLPEGHDSLDTSFAIQLSVLVDSEPEQVPANIGNTIDCMSELHTHREDGTVYVELYDANRLDSLTFSDFFTVWGVPMEREGYAVSITYNGVDVASIDDVPLEPDAEVELTYTSLPNEETEPTDSTIDIQGEI